MWRVAGQSVASQPRPSRQQKSRAGASPPRQQGGQAEAWPSVCRQEPAWRGQTAGSHVEAAARAAAKAEPTKAAHLAAPRHASRGLGGDAPRGASRAGPQGPAPAAPPPAPPPPNASGGKKPASGERGPHPGRAPRAVAAGVRAEGTRSLQRAGAPACAAGKSEEHAAAAAAAAEGSAGRGRPRMSRRPRGGGGGRPRGRREGRRPPLPPPPLERVEWRATASDGPGGSRAAPRLPLVRPPPRARREPAEPFGGRAPG